MSEPKNSEPVHQAEEEEVHALKQEILRLHDQHLKEMARRHREIERYQEIVDRLNLLSEEEGEERIQKVEKLRKELGF